MLVGPGSVKGILKTAPASSVAVGSSGGTGSAAAGGSMHNRHSKSVDLALSSVAASASSSASSSSSSRGHYGWRPSESKFDDAFSPSSPPAVSSSAAAGSASLPIAETPSSAARRFSLPQLAEVNDPAFDLDPKLPARFFVIKSLTEDDVHKAIKFQVWASTDAGNRRLDSAWRDALNKADHPPIFLFFSVNRSQWYAVSSLCLFL